MSLFVQTFDEADTECHSIFKKYRVYFYLYSILLTILNAIFHWPSFEWYTIFYYWFMVTGGYALCITLTYVAVDLLQAFWRWKSDKLSRWISVYWTLFAVIGGTLPMVFGTSFDAISEGWWIFSG